MKKRLLAVSLALITAVSFAGCEKSDENPTTTAQKSDLGETAEIKLGEYKGLTVYSDDIAVADSSLESYINERLELDSTTEYRTEGVVEEGSKVKVSYKGTVDGNEFTGGTTEGKVITINEYGFDVEGFTDGLIGHSIGETVELDLKFADDYSNTDLAGKDVHYSVKLDSLVVTVVPELTDDYVVEEYSALGLNTVGEFTEYLKHDLYINNIYAKIWPTIIENSEAVTYDEAKYNEYFQIVSENQEAEIYYYYGYELEEYLSSISMTIDDWNAQIDLYVKSVLKEEMVIEEIAKLENIEISDEDFNKKMLEYAKLYGYDTVEEFKADYSDISDEDFRFSVMTYYVQEYVAEQANVVQGTDPNNETSAATSIE